MSNASSIRQIHSKKSIQAVIDRTNKALATVPEDGSPPELPPVQPPKISVVDEYAEARKKKDELVSKLGYLNRNPSI